MLIKKIEFASFLDFYRSFLSPDGEYFQRIPECVFRGHSDSSYELIPTVFREEKKQLFLSGFSGGAEDSLCSLDLFQMYLEYVQLSRFYAIANRQGLRLPRTSLLLQQNDVWSLHQLRELIGLCNGFWMPHDIAEVAALAQHYGFPTRLLDWTFDLKVALYFACRGILKKYQETINKSVEDSIGQSRKIAIYVLDKNVLSRLQSFEKELVLELIVPAYAENPNLCAQKGLLSNWPFLISETYDSTWSQLTTTAPLDKLLQETIDLQKLPTYLRDKTLLYKCEIALSLSGCIELYDYLLRNGYSESRLFPGFNGVVEEMKISGQVAKFRKIIKDEGTITMRSTLNSESF